jgi:uncharacterized protein YhfF
MVGRGVRRGRLRPTGGDALAAARRTLAGVTTPLPPVDRAEVEAFWARAVDAGAVAAGTAVPDTVEPFGDSVELADELIALVVDGPKRATAGAVAEYELEGVPLPRVGDLWIATDGAGRPRAVLRPTEVRTGPLTSVDDGFAWDEGEGDRTRESWLAAHQRFFGRHLPAIGLTYDPDLPTVFERFELLYAE